MNNDLSNENNQNIQNPQIPLEYNNENNNQGLNFDGQGLNQQNSFNQNELNNNQVMAQDTLNNSVQPGEKYRPLGKTLKNDFIFLLVLVSVILLLSLLELNIFRAIIYMIQLTGYIIGINMASKQKRGAGYVGIIFGILMMLAILYYDVLDAFLGLLLLIHSIKYIRRYDAQINNN